jgi:class 3 adenylate cyclase
LQLRVGLHRGACIVAVERGVLDYFGATVNVASRIARAAVADEVLISDAVADDPQVAARFPRGVRDKLELRGIDEPVGVMHIATPDPARSQRAPAA